MPPHRRASGLIGLAAALALGAGTAAEPGAGLIEGPGRELVYAHCSGCHGLDLVRAQRGDRDFWTTAIRRMQANENLWRFDPRTEDQILTYLSRHYGAPPFAGRRAPLPPSLQPSAGQRH